jgi:hypothetical protein
LRNRKLQPLKLKPSISKTKRIIKRTKEENSPSQTMGRGHSKETKNRTLVKTTAGTSTQVHSRKYKSMHKTFKIQNSIPKQSRHQIISQAKILDKNQI